MIQHVGVAQLDRASGYGPEGREFESSRPRYMKPINFHSLWAFKNLIVTSNASLPAFFDKSNWYSCPIFYVFVIF